MKCKKVRDLIITDYIDGELSPERTVEIEEHIKECGACRDFLMEVREKISGSLGTDVEMSPPEDVWEKIKETIEKERTPESLPSRGFRLRDIFMLPRPVALVFAVIAVIAVTVTIPRIFKEDHAVLGEYFMDNMEFLYYMDTEEFETDNGQSGTDMDINYFM